MKTVRQSSARRQHARVTIGDVARRAGVSPMTVSRVINGEANVRQSTREAVSLAIRELGYSPNKAARSLASANQVRIGLLYTNPSSTYLSAMLFGVLEQARHSDTQIVVVESGGADSSEAMRGMLRDGVDGVLLTPPVSDCIDALELLKQSDTPAVTMGTQRIEENVSSVSIDDYRAAHAMTRHILSLGHQRIGFIKGSPDQLASELRLAGFCDAMHEAGLEIADELIVQGDFSYRSGLDAADRLLNLEQLPTAVFAGNDDMAAATIATAHRYRVDVPKDLSVCGFDDTLLATTIWPQITTIHQPIADMSHAAIDLLAREIRCRRAGLENECQHLTLDFRLEKRHSDAPPFNADRPNPAVA